MYISKHFVYSTLQVWPSVPCKPYTECIYLQHVTMLPDLEYIEYPAFDTSIDPKSSLHFCAMYTIQYINLPI